ncbi:MAG: immunoglobulin-like domain-containing protein, partial [Acholeplasmataceae bacterium]
MKKKFIVLLVLIFGLVLASCDEPADDTIKLEDIQITITEFASGDSVSSVTEDFVLPIGFDNNVTATWESSNTNVIKISGKNAEVTRPEDSNKEVKLTPTLKYTNKDGDLIQLKREAITVTVIKAEEEVIDLSAIELVIVFATGDDINNVTEDFVLPVTFEGGVTATWVSDDTDVIVIEGKDATVTRSIESDKEVNLTATLKLDDETLERTPIKVTVLKLDLSPVVEGTLYHWMPNSVGANLVANIEIYDADPLDVEVKLNDYDLVEGLDFEVINDELIIYGDFLVEKSNQLGDYELEVSTLYGSTIFEFFVVDNPENTSIETKEIEVADMGSLTQAVLTEPIAGAPEVMITEIGSDAGKFSYVEVFNNTNKKRNLKGHMLVFANTAAEINLGTVVNNNGLFGVPMGAIPFLIDEDFELEPFETGIIWYVLGGNDTPYIVGVGGSYDEVGLAANANTWLF